MFLFLMLLGCTNASTFTLHSMLQIFNTIAKISLNKALNDLNLSKITVVIRKKIIILKKKSILHSKC